MILFCWKSNTCVTKQCSFSASPAFSPLHQSPLGSLVPGHSRSSPNVNYLHAFHHSSYEDLVQWDTQLQSCPGGNYYRDPAFCTAPWTPFTSDRPHRPVLTRTSLASHSALLSCDVSPNHGNLNVSMATTSADFVATILYRYWHLSAPASTPPRLCIPRHLPLSEFTRASLRRTDFRDLWW